MAVGDRITINSGGRERVLSVVTVDKLDSQVLPDLVGAADPAAARHLPRRRASRDARPVRFLIEAGEDLPAMSSAKAARTL